MLVVARIKVPVALVPWRTVRGRATLVVKVSYDVGAGGVAALSQQPDPLSDEVRAREGTLLFPSDYVLEKSQCDVMVIGRALVQSREPSVLVAPGIRKAVDRESLLGPMSATPPSQQQAPPDQRCSLSLPTKLRLERRERSISVLLPGPLPQVAVVRGSALGFLPVSIDAVAIDPERARIVVTSRAICDQLDSQPPSMVVVDVLGMLTEADLDEAWSWERAELPVYGASVDEGDAEEAMSETVSIQRNQSARPPDPQPAVEPLMHRSFGRTVPMSVTFGRSPNAYAAPADASGEDDDRITSVGESTVEVSSSRMRAAARALDDDESTHEGAHATRAAAPVPVVKPPVGVRPRDPRVTRRMPVSAVPPSAMPTGVTRRIDLPHEVEGVTINDLTVILRELFAAPGDRAQILQSRNLGELRFRLVQRKWVEHLVQAGFVEPTVNDEALLATLQKLTRL
ncbi:MAG: hypothetical protein U0271_16655 [Polyangiaceae bacterium]